MPGACGLDVVEEVALVACAKRDVLLRAHRHRLRKEDLEDCYSQATLELLANARAGRRYANQSHLAHTLELRFVSRIRDLSRAIAGRSPARAMMETAVPLSANASWTAIADRRAQVEKLVMLRHELSSVQLLARQLSADQRLVLAWQLGEGDGADFCRRFGWSAAKYRKVAQRARTRLSQLVRGAGVVVTPADGRRLGEEGPTYDYPAPHS